MIEQLRMAIMSEQAFGSASSAANDLARPAKCRAFLWAPKERLRPIRPYVSQIGCNDSVSAFMVLPATQL
jgi:hypothetical protein